MGFSYAFYYFLIIITSYFSTILCITFDRYKDFMEMLTVALYDDRIIN